MKRDRSINDNQTEISLKRLNLKNEIISEDKKQKECYFEMTRRNDLNSFNKRNIIEKVQSWLDHISSRNH
jgi:hypothetical protein